MQLAVGEHVGVDEAPRPRARTAAISRCAADAVVQQPSLGAEQPEQPFEVGLELREPDVLEHADRADRVVRTVAHVAVVLVADLDEVGEPGLGDALGAELGLLARERDPDARVRRDGAPRAGPCSPSRSRRRAAACRVRAPACGTRARASLPARLPDRPSATTTPRTSTSSSARGGSRRSRSTCRSGTRSRRRRARACAVDRAGALLRVVAGADATTTTPTSLQQRRELHGLEVQPVEALVQRQHGEEVAFDVEIAGDVGTRPSPSSPGAVTMRRSAFGERNTIAAGASTGPTRLPS